MIRKQKTFHIAFMFIGIFGMLTINYMCLSTLSFNSKNIILAEHFSPNTKYKVVVFERSGGATTSFSTQASLIMSDGKAPKDGGNIYISDSDHGRAPVDEHGGPFLFVDWISDDQVRLSYHQFTRTFKSLEKYEGINIEYVKLKRLQDYEPHRATKAEQTD